MDFQSAMETFAEAWVAANSGKIVLGSGSSSSSLAAAQNSPDPRLESPLQQQLGNSKGLVVVTDGSGSLGSDYPKIPSGMDLSSAASGGNSSSGAVGNNGSSNNRTVPAVVATTTSPPGKRLKGMTNRKLSPSHNHNNTNNSSPADFHSSSRSTPPLISHNIPNTVLGKSMPIHCVVEVCSEGNSGVNNNNTITTGTNSNGNRRDSIAYDSGLVSTTTQNSNNNNNGNTDTNSNPDGGSSSKVVVEVDDFVIIPAGTPFQDVVTTVLTLLGYPKDIIRQAEGTITLRNWKPLRLDQVCDSPMKTVGDILQDLANHATLRVLVTRAKGGNAEDLKEKLLRLLLAHSSTLLMGAGCPLDEVTMSQLVKGQWPQNLAEDVKRRFDQWYKSLHPGATLGLLESLQHSQLPPGTGAVTHGAGSGVAVAAVAAAAAAGVAGAHHHGGLIGAGSIHLPNHHPGNHLVNGSSGHHHHHQQPVLHHHHHQIPHHHELGAAKSGSFIDDDHNHPVFHGLVTQKTRMRTSFDPEMELPKLQQWFAENPHPSRHQIQQYVRELNLLECRKDRKPLDVNNVIYWFKNARAAQKRNELRYNGLPSHHHHQAFSHHHGQLGQQLPHLLHASHGGSLSDRQHDRSEGHSVHHGASMDISNGASSVNDHHSAGGSSRDSDDQDQEISKNGGDDDDDDDADEGAKGKKKCIKEERDDDYINVDTTTTDNGANNSGRSLHSPSKDASSGSSSNNNNNNEEPRDLSSKSPSKNDDETTEETEDKTEEGEEEENGGKVVVVEKREVVEDEDDENMESNGGDMMTMMGDENSNQNNSISSSASPRSSPGISHGSPSYDFNGPPSMVNRYHPFFEHPSFMAYRHFNSFNFGPNFGPNSSEGAAAYEAALNAARKSLLPGVGKPGGLDIFSPDFSPQGPLNGRSGSNGSNNNSGANNNNGTGASTGSGGGNSDPLSRLRAEELFPQRPASSADIINSIINSNRNEFSPLNLGNHHHHHHPHPHHHNPQSSLGMDERRKRNRTFIDPVTEVVLLENWFKIQTHPSHNLILKYTEELNRMPYRQKFPKLEPKNVQFWFKNRRAKCKRLKMNM